MPATAAPSATLPAASPSVGGRRRSSRTCARVASALEFSRGSSSISTLECSEEHTVNSLGQQLRGWIEEAGGYVHPALQLSYATQCGRGVVALEPLPPASAGQQPLIAVPEQLLLTTEAAQQLLGPALERAIIAAPPQPWWGALSGQRQQQRQAQQLLREPTMLLALLLACERNRGASSFWWPYIAALPDELPCGWALSQQRLAAELAALGGMAHGWAAQVQAAAAAVQQRAEAAEAAVGEQLGVSAADARWGLGHVVSRCFGSGADLALLPFIDLCNHQQHGPTPDGWTTAAGQPCAAVYGPQALPAGAELCISYVAGTSPLNMFLNFGFVPEEHRV